MRTNFGGPDSSVKASNAIQLLEILVNPQINCSIGGVEIDGALIIGAGGGIGVGQCRGNDGSRWGVFSPTLNKIELGFGTSILYYSYHFALTPESVGFSSTNYMVGTIFAERGLIMNEGIEAYGIGAGIMLIETNGVALKLLPLSQDFSKLIKLI